MAIKHKYILVGNRPVKTAKDPDDGLIYVWAWDWDRRIFVKAPEYFDHVYQPTDQDITFLDEESFDKAVDELLFA